MSNDSDETLIERIFQDPSLIDTLTDEEQEQLLTDYQTLAEHWATSPKSPFQDLAREILWMLEAAGTKPKPDRQGKTLH